MKKRAVFYWAKLYSYQISEGKDYSLLNDVISINLLNFRLFTNHDRCHTACHITDDFDKKTVIKDFEMHFIELPKFKLGDIKRLSKNEKWIALFSNKCTDEELEEIAMSELTIKKVLDYQAYFIHDKKLRYKYELQEKAIRNYNSGMLATKEEGMQLGEHNRAVKTALRLLKRGYNIVDIAEDTELSIEEVKQLQSQLNK